MYVFIFIPCVHNMWSNIYICMYIGVVDIYIIVVKYTKMTWVNELERHRSHCVRKKERKRERERVMKKE